MRRVKQLGVNHVTVGGPEIPPGTQTQIRMAWLIASEKQVGQLLGNLMISGFTNTIYGKAWP